MVKSEGNVWRKKHPSRSIVLLFLCSVAYFHEINNKWSSARWSWVDLCSSLSCLRMRKIKNKEWNRPFPSPWLCRGKALTPQSWVSQVELSLVLQHWIGFKRMSFPWRPLSCPRVLVARPICCWSNGNGNGNGNERNVAFQISLKSALCCSTEACVFDTSHIDSTDAPVVVLDKLHESVTRKFVRNGSLDHIFANI